MRKLHNAPEIHEMCCCIDYYLTFKTLCYYNWIAEIYALTREKFKCT